MQYKRSHKFKPFIDLFLLLTGTLLVIIALLKVPKEEDSVPKNALYEIVLEWDSKSNTDLDLWAKDPAGNVVGFNRRQEGHMSLNHDALGRERNGSDDVKFHEEIITIRGIVVGEFIVNIHNYNHQSSSNEVAKVSLRKVKPAKKLKEQELTFEADGDEKTAFRFIMNKDGGIEEINDLPSQFVTLEEEGM